LAEWASAYDRTMDRADPIRSGFRSEEEANAHQALGRALARRLAVELGEATEVIVWNEQLRRAEPVSAGGIDER
jgi:hypothetical protein